MRVLLIGATGNLGSRLIPALLIHHIECVAFVRSPAKLHSLLSPELHKRVTVTRGDATETSTVEEALRSYSCDALVSAFGQAPFLGRDAVYGRVASAVTSAAIRVGREKGQPLRAWFIGGLGSLELPGSGGKQIQDFLPGPMTAHHRQTEEVLKQIDARDLEWSLLCVAWMVPASKALLEPLEKPCEHGLTVSVREPPAWQDSWLRSVPIINIMTVISTSYTTELEKVADFIAEDLTQSDHSKFVGELVGLKS